MEATKIKMNMDGTFRAKVLQYKSDGNTLTEKRETLTKYAEGVYYTTDDDGYGNTIHGIVFEAKGVYWWSRQALRPEELNADNIYCQKVIEKRRNFERDVLAQAEAGQYINNLQIEVMRRLGYDVAELQAAHDEYIRQREERDRLQAEEAQRRERERVEAEERRNAEVLADGKEKLLKHESITVEQIELIAEAVGYKINIRTIGFMREKVTEVVMLDNDRVQVFGYKLTSRNIDGTTKVMYELYDRLKKQAEEEAIESVRHISEIMEENNLHGVGYEQTDERRYYDWLYYADLLNYRTIADKALAEALTWIYVAAYRKGKGHIIAMNKDGVLIETVIAAAQATETLQISTEAAETVNVSAEGGNTAERKENKPTSADVVQMVKTELAKNKAMRTAWHLEFPDGTECDVRYKNTVAGCDFYDYSERNGKIERFRDYPAVVSDITLYICQALGIDALEPPQSPRTPQMVNYTTDTAKLAQTA